jgi:hypothetical protein
MAAELEIDSHRGCMRSSSAMFAIIAPDSSDSGRVRADAPRRETYLVLECLLRTLAQWRPAYLFAQLLYPALVLAALVMLGQLAGVIGLPT